MDWSKSYKKMDQSSRQILWWSPNRHAFRCSELSHVNVERGSPDTKCMRQIFEISAEKVHAKFSSAIYIWVYAPCTDDRRLSIYKFRIVARSNSVYLTIHLWYQPTSWKRQCPDIGYRIDAIPTTTAKLILNESNELVLWQLLFRYITHYELYSGESFQYIWRTKSMELCSMCYSCIQGTD